MVDSLYIFSAVLVIAGASYLGTTAYALYWRSTELFFCAALTILVAAMVTIAVQMLRLAF